MNTDDQLSLADGDARNLYLKFCKFEVDNQLFTKKIRGVHYWDRIRAQVYRNIRQCLIAQTDNYSTKTDDSKSSRLIKLTDRLYNIVRSSSHTNLLPPDAQVLFWAAEEDRRREFRGKYWDIIVDPQLNQISQSAVSVESGSEIIKHCDGELKTANVLNSDIYTLLGAIRKNLKRYKSLRTDEADSLTQIESEIESRFNTSIDLLNIVNTELMNRKLRKPVIRNLLKIIQPDVIIIRHNPSKTTLIEVAQDMDITVVELQHGVDMIESFAISYPYSVKGKLIYPDVYFSWGEKWKKQPRFPIDDVRVVGWPFINYMKKQYQTNSNDFENHVLFLSQPSSAPKLIELALYLSKTCDYDVTYRLHPSKRSNWKSTYPNLRRNEITIDDGSNNLYSQFNKSQAVIGTNSTAVFEALKFDTPALIHAPSTVPRISELLSPIKSAKLFETKAELRQALSTTSVSLNTDKLFEPNAMQNFQTEINDMCDT